MSDRKTIVLKFGGSVLRDEEDLPLVVHEIYRHWRRGAKVLAVVSAFGGTTDALLSKGNSFGDELHPEAVATLLLTGEATSAALLALSLKKSGIPAKLLTPEQVGIRTTGDPLDAEPVDANTGRIGKELLSSVVIVSGFAGINDSGDPTLLGRGGTDYTALFLAEKLEGKCILIKDVEGLFDRNPKQHGYRARRYAEASYRTTLRLGGELVQPKAVRFAQDNQLPFEISALAADHTTVVGTDNDLLDGYPNENPPRVRVALLGCGTVGGGVYERLSAMSDRFEIVGVSNLHPRKAVLFGIDEHLIEPDPFRLIRRDCDVVIELIGGEEPAYELIKRSLKAGKHVITANKAVLASHGFEFDNIASQQGVACRYSAAVGGSLPALEAAYRSTISARPKAIKGIINGTTNFICDQLATGRDFHSSVKLAQKNGFAEADPTVDLDGTDAAQKLVLLARATFGVNLSLENVRKEGIDSLSPQKIRSARENGTVYRLIAECKKTDTGVEAIVRPVEIPGSHTFASVKGAENCLVIEGECGRTTVLRGRGAGRYATTESVIADLFDIRATVVAARRAADIFSATRRASA